MSVDCGAIVEGWHGDAAISIRHARCRRMTFDTLSEGDAIVACGQGWTQARVGHHSVGHRARCRGTCIRGAGGPTESWRSTSGTASDLQMHMHPPVPNYGTSGQRGRRLEAGMALAIEPMATLGTANVRSPR